MTAATPLPGASPRGHLQPTVLLTLALMAVIAMMVLPMPSWLLDAGLALSFALAILILAITLFIERPLDFSAFPTVLIAALMLRLSLNVSSTKLIISQGHTGTDAAGHVIEGFAMFIMSGSLVIGLVIFTVLLIVNFIVITKGAGRMAEVGARFALDAMPGKQMAIDADMNSGAIDHAEARARREREQAETTFFGSLDGASKFVKGDAIAGLLITALNFVVGLSMGVFAHGMPVGLALETYAILAVGDALVNQIPAVVISIAAAILLSRGGARGTADREMFGQLGRYPAATGTVGLLMAFFAFMPGLPFVPFIAGAAGLAALAWAGSRAAAATAARDAAQGARAEPDSARPRPIGDTLDLDDIHVEFAPDLVPLALDPVTGLDARIVNMRTFVAATYGIILPEIRLTDDRNLDAGRYRLRLHGVEQGGDRLRLGQALVLMPPDAGAVPEGEDVKEPVYGAPARWIPAALQEEVVIAGMTVVAPAEVLATHLLEVIRRNLARLLTLKSLRRLLSELCTLSDAARAEANRRLFDELIPEKVPVDLLLAVLKLLLEERVSIRNLPLILEAIAELRGSQPPEAACEHVRQRLGFQIAAGLKRADGTLPLLQLAPEWEATFREFQVEGERGQLDVALPPERFNRLASGVADRLAAAAEGGTRPALVTLGRRRRFLRAVLAARGIDAPVLAMEEIPPDARPALVGLIAA